MEYEFNILVIGAGVVGLAVARELSQVGLFTGILEKNHKYGLETSSRNSEVIHSGIHYPPGSLKAKLSVEGNSLLYSYCQKKDIIHKKTGKLTVATSPEEIETLQDIYNKGISNGVSEMKFIGRQEVFNLLPDISCKKGCYTGTSGLINAHNLMDCLYNDFLQTGGMAGFGEEVVGIENFNKGYKVFTEAGSEYTTQVLVNSTGLFSDKISKMLGLSHNLYWAKGDYFTIEQGPNIPFPVYPIPGKDFLGIHLTPKIGGGLRAGPDIEYVEKQNHPYPSEKDMSCFMVDETKQGLFYKEIKKYLPNFNIEHLVPEMYGIRAKLQSPKDCFKDFFIQEELQNFINLVGIESPGLTSCLSIAKYVKSLVDDIIKRS
ncbi:NAD(P)/FAD-dependent oxidoreductase [bacterium]|nr:NAD(P)/FAD-dependent oxidoreductase [bacterium]